MTMRLEYSPKETTPTRAKVPWHQWSVVRLAAIAMVTVLIGFITAAFMAMQSIDQLIHMAHDGDIEWSIQYGMDQARDAYSAKQSLVLEKLTRKAGGKNLKEADVNQILSDINATSILGSSQWSIQTGSTRSPGEWKSRQELAFQHHIIDFGETSASESFHRAEEILQRYKLIGLDLKERIRPALIRSLSITLAVMCVLLLTAFVIMASRFRSRIQAIVDGFERYAEVDQSFRFSSDWQSELGLISRQFNQMADEVSDNRIRAVGLEKLASWQTIARKMAHEIKNPLTPIQIMIGQLKRNYKGDDTKFQALVDNAHKVILEEVAGLRRMVDDFSEFARLPHSELNYNDLVASARKAVDLIGTTYAPHTIELKTKLDDLWVDHDPQLLRHLIHNLIKNAAEADADSATVISVEVLQDHGHAVISVNDRGPGIPIYLKEKIFEAYMTTKHTGPTPGMGLGLAICQKVAFEHGGTLSLASEPGNTTFTLKFPIRKKVSHHG